MALFGLGCLSGLACGRAGGGEKDGCRPGGCTVSRFWGGFSMPVIMFGLLCVSVGLLGLSAWWWSVVELLRGILPLVLIFIGVLALASGVSGFRKDGRVSDESLSGED